MYLSPVKHTYAWLPRKCDYRTDRRTDRQTDGQTDAIQSDPNVPLCFAGDRKIQNRIKLLQERIEYGNSCFLVYYAILFYSAPNSVLYSILFCILFYSILQALFLGNKSALIYVLKCIYVFKRLKLTILCNKIFTKLGILQDRINRVDNKIE